MKDYIMLTIILILLSIFSFTGGVLLETFGLSDQIKNRITMNDLKLDGENLTVCNDMELEETAFCLREWMREFYNYTARNELKYNDEEGTFNDIKSNGGDCHDYSKIYKEMLEDRGFLVEPISFYQTKFNEDGYREGHELIIAYNHNLTGYCRMDMMNVDCIEFKIE